MGATSEHRERGQSHAEFFAERLLGPDDRMLDSHTKGSTFYMAIERDGEVFAGIVEFSWAPNDYWNFTYRAMCEHEGPYFYDCPARILALLTPTDHERANEWREACRKRAAAKAAKPKVKPGDTVKFAEPITFTDGSEEDTFTLEGRSTFRLPGGWGRVKITRWKDRDYEVVPA